MHSEHLLAFIAAAFVLIVIPGPSVLFVVSRSITLGWRTGLTTVVGNAAGVYIHVIVVAVGFGAILDRSTVP